MLPKTFNVSLNSLSKRELRELTIYAVAKHRFEPNLLGYAYLTLLQKPEYEKYE